ncbi:MAG: hypothetical protein ACLGGX_00145 [Bdellovibrionia bacterium]
MAYYCRVLQSSDIEEILKFEEQKLQELIPDESERMFASWNSRARREALEHYSQLGWSFLARDSQKPNEFSSEGTLVGYFLGQPLLFFEGQTQSLWVEHIQTSNEQASMELIDLAYRLSREKHFQKVFLPKGASGLPPVSFENWQPQVLTAKTTKAL